MTEPSELLPLIAAVLNRCGRDEAFGALKVLGFDDPPGSAAVESALEDWIVDHYVPNPKEERW